MAQIIPKLNLNKTPALVQNNSLIFAKNIRLDVDGTIHRDYGVFPMSINKGKHTDNFVNYNNIVNRILSDMENNDLFNNPYAFYFKTIYNNLKYISGRSIEEDEIIYKNGKYKIVGVIANSNEFYLFINGTYDKIEYGEAIDYTINCIICYNEKEDKFYPCNCNWNWSGGDITGCVINNLVGDTILNIGEYNTTTKVPIKSINLTISKFDDDETIYTQIPNIPITNLSYSTDFAYTIPNGVYQFFVRYKIDEDFYTDWFSASNEIFVGNKNSVVTSYGTLNYVNIHRDSDNSFILNVEYLIDNYKANYKGYQIGFILSHDDASYARAWKHFDFNTTYINFDYRAEDSEEIEIIDLFKVTFGLYNVGNITTFKNKLYISNYTESNFNDKNLSSYADAIEISLDNKKDENNFGGSILNTITIAGKSVANGLVLGENVLHFTGSIGIFYAILFKDAAANGGFEESPILNNINKAIENNNPIYSLSENIDLGFGIKTIIEDISLGKQEVIENNKSVNDNNIKIKFDIDFTDDAVKQIKINNKTIDIPEGKEYIDVIYDYIINTDRYLDSNCNWIDNTGQLAKDFTITLYRTAKIKKHTIFLNNSSTISRNAFVDSSINENIYDLIRPTEDQFIPNPNTPTTDNITEFTQSYKQNITVTFLVEKSYYHGSSVHGLINLTTLIPYQKYKFYIHFVKSNGEITNGYYCSNAGELEAPYMEHCNSVIYPKFYNIQIPEGYVACFFSICHTKINSSTLVNIKKPTGYNYREGSSLDVNMMFGYGFENLTIKQGDNTVFDGTYHYSSDPDKPRYFGADGIITFDETANNEDYKIQLDKLAYVVNDYSISETDTIELIKCTPYINSTNINVENGKSCFSDYTKMNLLGYICKVSLFDRQRTIDYYNDGSSVFLKKITSPSISTTKPEITLKELNKYDKDGTDEEKLSKFKLISSDNIYIYSNYNLNYVTLSDDPKMVIKTYYDRSANADGQATEKQENDTYSIVLRLIPSQLMSDVYSLPSMYKTYLRKTYSTYTDNNTTLFENTVRSSMLYGDENKVYVLKFDANDYYNIPTNRGTITNLVAIGDAIIVHTKDSIFKFSGSNNLESSEGEIQTAESKPFDTGVSEVFGSDFGFAGLQYKSDYIITENGYIFFDRDSRIVYIYSGNGQILKISDSIEKLFRHKDIDNITFANDYYNNRFFMSVMFKDNNDIYPVTLSFNISENIKSFVSLHDFYYTFAFNTKTKCYFLSDNRNNIFNINKNYKGCYTGLELFKDRTYPQKKDDIVFKFVNEDKEDAELIEYNINSYNSIIDIICNEQFENIKTLNAINWCGTKIKEEFVNIDENDLTSLMIAEDINYEIPCKYLRIYTDSCMTPLNDCTKISNNYSITSSNSFTYPRYNQGRWTFNYFRNILNSNNIKEYFSDNNSLIEGKYFISRFVFDSDFKFETLTLNYDIKQ